VTQYLERSSTADAERYRLAWARYPADSITPVGAFLALRAAGRQVCLLESVEKSARLTRFSFLGVDPVASFRGGPDGCELRHGADTVNLDGPSHEALREAARRFSVPRPPRGLPPFIGGWVGYFTFEWASTLEPSIPRAADDPWQLPEATFDLYREIIAFDHAAQVSFVISGCPAGADDYGAATERIDTIAADISASGIESGLFERRTPEPVACTPEDRFGAGVKSLKESIAQGEIFQAVLSQRFVQGFDGDPFTLYRALRLTNPSPHMFYFEADGVTLVGSSPERLVRVNGDLVQTVPIAGTRPRGEEAAEDERLAFDLLADPKERAEHDMLVDLSRNDLGRIARVGTVEVKEYASLEKFSRVQHLVSRVECRLASGFDALDALAASFPAGTVSGAPKIRAMELLAETEGQTRGPYAGCFGYLDGSGNLDMAITIRTLVVRGDEIHLQVGAGIVHDSHPPAEFAETLHKSQALRESITLADSPCFRPCFRPAAEEARR
jgi:anthranilate synthase component I